jgi:hypothetical protein
MKGKNDFTGNTRICPNPLLNVSSPIQEIVSFHRGGVMIDPVFRNVRLLPGTIHAGFHSPASDYEERELDINDLVVPHSTTSGTP